LNVLEGILSLLASGYVPVEIARQFGVEFDLIENIEIAAHAISQKVGARGRQRLSDNGGESPAQSESARAISIPRAPRTRQARQLAGSIFGLWTEPKSIVADQTKMLERIVDGINAHDVEIRFYHPDDLRIVVRSLALLIPSALWQAEIRRRPGRLHGLAMRRWRAAVGEGASIKETFLPAAANGLSETKAGTALVRIQLQDDPVDGPARATAGVKYAAIMALTYISAVTSLTQTFR
jgi:hypothetical protein